MSIPDVISEAFAYETATFNGRIKRLGFKDDIEWFIYSYKEPSEIGFPIIYGLKNGELKQARSFEALYIITSLVKDEIISNQSDNCAFNKFILRIQENQMKIPSIIKEAFSFEIANFKGHIKRLGEKDGVEWFVYLRGY